MRLGTFSCGRESYASCLQGFRIRDNGDVLGSCAESFVCPLSQATARKWRRGWRHRAPAAEIDIALSNFASLHDIVRVFIPNPEVANLHHGPLMEVPVAREEEPEESDHSLSNRVGVERGRAIG